MKLEPQQEMKLRKLIWRHVQSHHPCAFEDKADTEQEIINYVKSLGEPTPPERSEER